MKKNIDLESIIRPNIRDLKPYRSARDDFDSGILLDVNENAMGAPFDNEDELHRYPMPYQNELRNKIAEYRGVNRDNIFVGVGSDEAIDLVYRIFCEPGKDTVLITPPTYGMYKVSASINNVGIASVTLTEDFQLNVEETLETARREHCKVIFLCSPNNPTANRLHSEDIIRILDEFDGIVVVDEAYIDFSTAPGFSGEVLNRNNLIVLQTMSKSFGLAGIRLGIAIADTEIIQYMMKVKAPYNINKLTSKAALKGMGYLNAMSARVQQILEKREKVIKGLNNIPAVEKVFPSDANFVLFRIPNALEVYKKLAEYGVIVRYRGNEPHCENCLRMTIGTTDENNRFFKALEKVLAD